MATISLDTAQIQSLNSEISTLDSTLLGTYFPSVTEELSAISANVQGDELQGIIATINSQFGSVNTALSTALPKLETFLEEQLKNYTTTETELDEELRSVLAKILNFVGVDADKLFQTFGWSTNNNNSNNPSISGNSGSSSATSGGATSGDSTSESSGSSHSIWGNMAKGAVSGAAGGAAVGTLWCPGAGTAVGAVAGAVLGGLTPVVCDLGGKVVWGLGEACSGIGSFLEKAAGDW